jgi:uracil-DNA glycosylase
LTFNPELLRLEREIPTCNLFYDCADHAGQIIELSNIAAGDTRRGTHDARILIVTEAPDTRSAKGVAYRGGTGTRIMRMFLRPEYGISVDYEDYGNEGVPGFLKDQRIYQTSAVKCVLHGIPANLGERVVSNCRQKFLDVQIAHLTSLELILPMGRLAISSVLRRPLDTLDYESIISRSGRGILQSDRRYGKTVVALPHPSGMNRSFNPPILRNGDSASVARRKQSFARALSAVRAKLVAMGYSVRSLPRTDRFGPLDRL